MRSSRKPALRSMRELAPVPVREPITPGLVMRMVPVLPVTLLLVTRMAPENPLTSEGARKSVPVPVFSRVPVPVRAPLMT